MRLPYSFQFAPDNSQLSSGCCHWNIHVPSEPSPEYPRHWKYFCHCSFGHPPEPVRHSHRYLPRVPPRRRLPHIPDGPLCKPPGHLIKPFPENDILPEPLDRPPVLPRMHPHPAFWAPKPLPEPPRLPQEPPPFFSAGRRLPQGLPLLPEGPPSPPIPLLPFYCMYLFRPPQPTHNFPTLFRWICFHYIRSMPVYSLLP